MTIVALALPGRKSRVMGRMFDDGTVEDLLTSRLYKVARIEVIDNHGDLIYQDGTSRPIQVSVVFAGEEVTP